MKTLSDKKTCYWNEKENRFIDLFKPEDIKEFIKDLKIAIVENDIFTADEIFRVINETAGDKLI